MVLAGAAVDRWSPGPVIAGFGIAGTLAALIVIADRARVRSRATQPAAGPPGPLPVPEPAPAHPDTPAVPVLLAAPVGPAGPATQASIQAGDNSDALAGPEPANETAAANLPATPAAPKHGSRGRHRAR
jgi:hypothetical protein